MDAYEQLETAAGKPLSLEDWDAIIVALRAVGELSDKGVDAIRAVIKKVPQS